MVVVRRIVRHWSFQTLMAFLAGMVVSFFYADWLEPSFSEPNLKRLETIQPRRPVLVKPVSDSAPQNPPEKTYWLLNESLPYWEWYARADQVKRIEYVARENAIEKCLELSQQHDSGEVFVDEHFTLPKQYLHSLQELSELPQYFSSVAIQVSKQDSDFDFVYTNPRFFGTNLCSNLNRPDGYRNWNAEMSAYCVENVNMPAPELADNHPDLRVPVLTCSKSIYLSSKGYLRKNKYKVVPISSCIAWKPENEDQEIPGSQRVSGTVFTINHQWGHAVYHQLIEGLTRLSVHYEELLRRKEILIHSGGSDVANAYLNFLGFESSRLITGYVVPERLVMPDPSHCGRARDYRLRILRDILNMRLLEHFRADPPRRNQSVLVIRRSNTRAISNFDEMLRKLEELLPGLSFSVFRDDPVPPVHDVLRMFYQAKLVVAPHGAGLANSILCAPGTPILEFLTDDEHVNSCFAWQSRALGLHHYGFAPRGSSSYGSAHFHVDLSQLESVVRLILREHLS